MIDQNTKGTFGPILVVEDDAATREIVTETLRDAGYAVVSCADGAEALHLLRSESTVRPALILLDWRMPTPGAVFAHEYRQMAAPHAPLVVLTAANDVVDAAVAVDAKGFLRKPFDLEELVEVVERCCGAN